MCYFLLGYWKLKKQIWKHPVKSGAMEKKKNGGEKGICHAQGWPPHEEVESDAGGWSDECSVELHDSEWLIPLEMRNVDGNQEVVDLCPTGTSDGLQMPLR